MKRQGRNIVLFAAFFVFCVLIFPASRGDEEWDTGTGIDKRDPFVPLIGAGRRAGGSMGRVVTVDDIMLEGITWDPGGKSLAIVNGEIIGEGGKIGNLKVIGIEKDKIVVVFNGKQYVIPFRGEGG